MAASDIKHLNIGNYFGGNVSGGNIAGQDLTIGNENMTTINQTVTGNTIHGSVVAAEKIENSFNSLQESKANNEVKDLLGQLLTEIKALNAKVPEAQAQQFADMAEETETLIGETGRETPRKKWYEASLSGIKEAALAIGDIAKPVLAVAEKLSPLLLSL
jgi:molecular chaperone DnaK (HSP70)